LKVSAHLCAIAITSVLSVAASDPNVKINIATAKNLR
jgi:hypothetical protein